MNMRETDEQIVVKVRGSDKEAFVDTVRFWVREKLFFLLQPPK